uniref:Endonuclease domain-containing 1 protein n=2 Tax=Esox lucius TaxID=8010 RepID=A0AAY5KE95_ESOLU
MRKGVLMLLSALFLSLLPPGLSDVVDTFSEKNCLTFFLNGKTPSIPGILVNGNVQDQKRYKPICQNYTKVYRFATLYDTANKIPVFSAYKFTGFVKGRPSQAWMIEPELEQQALDADYNVGNRNDMHRGHLYPCSHANCYTEQRATFTLTNAVPQVSSFNIGSWKKVEGSIRLEMKKSCLQKRKQIEAYVVTGAIPGKKIMNNEVNIPSVMWTAYCCYNSETKNWISKAHWGLNKPERKGIKQTGKTLEE